MSHVRVATGYLVRQDGVGLITGDDPRDLVDAPQAPVLRQLAEEADLELAVSAVPLGDGDAVPVGDPAAVAESLDDFGGSSGAFDEYLAT